MELFLYIFHISQHQHRLVILQQCIGGDVHIQYTIVPQCHDVDVIFFADIQFAYGFPDPGIRYGDFEDPVFFIQLDVVKD